MKRKALVVGGIGLGALILIGLLAGPAVPLLVRLGVKPVCIQGDWPRLRVVPCPDLATVTPMPLQAPDDLVPVPIIVDDDGSPDGILALLFFLRHPHYDVRAVTVSPGEAHPDRFAPLAAQLLAAMGRPDIPVGAGRDTPLEGDHAFPEPWRQGSDAFWGIALPEAPAPVAPVPAAGLIVETLTASTQPVSVFVGGPHTNLAEALRLDPAIGQQIGDVYIMGGSVYVPGNIERDWPEIPNQVAEWNIWVDPVAAREVFASGLALHLVPLDGTNQVMWSEADVRAWASSTTPEGALAAEVLRSWLDSWSATEAYLWDLVAAVAATDPRLCPEVPLALDVDVEPGPEQGRILVADGPANVEVCLEPDAGQVRARVADLLGRAE
jgi:purine nucleosidase/pyrimidine-specific ribonucleoside hydrolase